MRLALCPLPSALSQQKHNIMKNLTLNIVIVFFFAGIFSANAVAPNGNDKKNDSHQISINIPKFSMLKIASSNDNVEFEGVVPENAGDKITFKQKSNSELFLNYSSIVGNGKTNTISAKASGLPAGLTVKVKVDPEAQNSKKGKTGRGLSKTLDASGVDVVEGIGSCFTGFGQGKGHKIAYEVEANEKAYDEIVAQDANITVTYTITEN